MFARVLLGCVVLCGLAFATLAEEPKPAKETKLKPTAMFRGSHSAIQLATARGKFEVVSNEKDWKKLWKEHRGDEATRLFAESDQNCDIDFDTQYVVAVFYGSSPGGEVELRQRGDTALIGYRNTYYQTEGGAADLRPDIRKAQEATTSHYAFVILPKPVKTIVIEKDIQNELGKPPIWEEQKRFPAPKDKK
jgi:hypothetical protein